MTLRGLTPWPQQVLSITLLNISLKYIWVQRHDTSKTSSTSKKLESTVIWHLIVEREREIVDALSIYVTVDKITVQLGKIR